MNPNHKSGFVSIIGKPNAGKSTLFNALVGEKLAIITPKAQTTRHRIFGILNTEDYQIVLSDTPGILEPKYNLHKTLLSAVYQALEDADLLVLLTSIDDDFDHEKTLEYLQNTSIPVFIALNKCDLASQAQIEEKMKFWSEKFPKSPVLPLSALRKQAVSDLRDFMIRAMPAHPPYFDKDALTDKPERFFAAEILREKIFENYEEEIPYCTQVSIFEFKEKEEIIKISAEIYVEKLSQKAIIIGKEGKMLKKVGTQARLEMEAFFGKKVFLEQYVRVQENWRRDDKALKRFGYLNE
jgi:GTP-binding protein Era